MNTWSVTYMAYSPKDPNTVVAQGDMTVQTYTPDMAQNVVKSMFPGRVIIFSTVLQRK